jgi:hypothetical protein
MIVMYRSLSLVCAVSSGLIQDGLPPSWYPSCRALTSEIFIAGEIPVLKFEALLSHVPYFVPCRPSDPQT